MVEDRIQKLKIFKGSQKGATLQDYTIGETLPGAQYPKNPGTRHILKFKTRDPEHPE